MDYWYILWSSIRIQVNLWSNPNGFGFSQTYQIPKQVLQTFDTFDSWWTPLSINDSLKVRGHQADPFVYRCTIASSYLIWLYSHKLSGSYSWSRGRKSSTSPFAHLWVLPFPALSVHLFPRKSRRGEKGEIWLQCPIFLVIEGYLFEENETKMYCFQDPGCFKWIF